MYFEVKNFERMDDVRITECEVAYWSVPCNSGRPECL